MSDQFIVETAVFIDGDWLHFTALRLRQEIDYAKLWVILHEYFGEEAPVYFIGSRDPQNKDQTEFLFFLRDLGYLVEVAEITKRKEVITVKGLDVRLAVRAATLPPETKNVVLITGDSDFIPLVEILKQHGKNVVVATLPASSRALVNAADRFLNLERLLRNSKNDDRVSHNKKKIIPPKSLYIEKGEYFAPYLAVRELFLAAKSEIILIDWYVNDQVLQMVHLLSNQIKTRIITNRISPADFCIQVAKLRNEGYQLTIQKSNAFHDRFLFVDGEWWHSGHSFKDLGGKDSMINKLDDLAAIKKLQERVQQEIIVAQELCL